MCIPADATVQYSRIFKSVTLSTFFEDNFYIFYCRLLSLHNVTSHNYVTRMENLVNFIRKSSEHHNTFPSRPTSVLCSVLRSERENFGRIYNSCNGREENVV